MCIQIIMMFTELPESKSDEFTRLFPGNREGLVQHQSDNPDGTVLRTACSQQVEKIYRLPLRRDDVWIVTFPKCGTTWVQELVWLIVNDCDIEGASKKFLPKRSPFIEQEMAMNPLSTLEEFPSPRVIKTHLPLHLLNPQLLDVCKVVYVARNPKDVIVSSYFHHKLFKIHDYRGDLDTFARYFMSNKIAYSPFFAHVIDGWQNRNHSNLLFLFYENLKQDLRGEIKRVANFLDRDLNNEQMMRLTEHLSIDHFKLNQSVNYENYKKIGKLNMQGNFIRKGETGDWMNHFSEELNSRVDEWIETNLAGTDLKFMTELTD